MIYIIMCTFNGERYIKEQLQSIVDNIMEDWKLFISDDQSADCTMKIAGEFQEKHPDKIFIYYNSSKKGAIGNFLNKIYETGLLMAEDDYIMLCDQDDIWNPDKIEKTMKGMKELIKTYGNNRPLLVCTDVCVADDDMNVINESFRRMNHYSIKNLDFPHLMMENKVQGCTVMINRSLALMLKKMPKRATMHDGWLGLIAAAFGKVKYIDEPTMKYRQHDNNVQGSVAYKDDVKNKFSNLKEQRQIVMNTTGQIAEFIDIYAELLSPEVRRQAEAFATLPQQNFFVRRYNIFKYHMWKSGALRNIGLLLLI